MFRSVFGPSIPTGLYRHQLANKTTSFAESLVGDVQSRVCKRVGTLAHDGWQNLGMKVVNTAMLSFGEAFFVASDPVEHADTPTLKKLFKERRNEVRSKYGFIVIAQVTDNATAYTCALDELEKELEKEGDKCIMLRCGMHSISLIVADFAKLTPIKTALEVVDEVLGLFTDPTLANRLKDL